MSSPHRKILRSQENVTSQSAAEQAGSPPKPPRSPFMCFADSRKEEILSERRNVAADDDILAIVASEWRNLDESVRASWDEVARDDKVRYVREKAEYKGPWVAPKRRAKKHPLAPKRPMSAFLKYSQNRRTMIKEQNPDMGNTDVSRLLGEMWRNASEAERRPYVEQELLERAAYNETIKKFREQQAQLDVASRTSHHAVEKIAESCHRRPDGPLPLGYDPFLPFEPLRIHSADEAANKVDEQAMMNHYPIPYYKANADNSQQRPMFRHQEPRDDRYPQPLYPHHAATFRPEPSGHAPVDNCQVDMQSSQLSPAHAKSIPHYSSARDPRGAFGFPERSFYHYP